MIDPSMKDMTPAKISGSGDLIYEEKEAGKIPGFIDMRSGNRAEKFG
jgi:hypothetical protein